MAGVADTIDDAVRRVMDSVNVPGTPVGNKFTAQQAMGHVQAGQRWFINALIEAGVDRVRTKAEFSLGAAITQWDTNNYFREPLYLEERANGTTGLWLPMIHQPIPPNAPTTLLRYWWDYYDAQVWFNAGTGTNTIRAWYLHDIEDLTLPFDVMLVKGALDPVANYATGLALATTGKPGPAQLFMDLAKQNTTQWINTEVHEMQQTPARQIRPNFTNPGWWYGF